MCIINKLGVFILVTLISLFSSIAFATERDYVQLESLGIPADAPYAVADVITDGYAGTTPRCYAYSLFNKSPSVQETCTWLDRSTPVPDYFLVTVRYNYQLPGWTTIVDNPRHIKCIIHIDFHSSLPPTVSSCQSN